MKSIIKWEILNFTNAMVRFVSADNFYICDACGKIHKRDGDEIRFDEPDIGELLAPKIFCKSVSQECANKTIRDACEALRKEMMK